MSTAVDTRPQEPEPWVQADELTNWNKLFIAQLHFLVSNTKKEMVVKALLALPASNTRSQGGRRS